MLAMELFCSYACDPVEEGTGCAFRMTVVFARMIKQDKLLKIPPSAGDIR